MMETTQMRNADNLAAIGRFNLPWHRSIMVARRMWLGVMVIVEILTQDPEQIGLV